MYIYIQIDRQIFNLRLTVKRRTNSADDKGRDGQEGEFQIGSKKDVSKKNAIQRGGEKIVGLFGSKKDVSKKTQYNKGGE